MSGHNPPGEGSYDLQLDPQGGHPSAPPQTPPGYGYPQQYQMSQSGGYPQSAYPQGYPQGGYPPQGQHPPGQYPQGQYPQAYPPEAYAQYAQQQQQQQGYPQGYPQGASDSGPYTAPGAGGGYPTPPGSAVSQSSRTVGDGAMATSQTVGGPSVGSGGVSQSSVTYGDAPSGSSTVGSMSASVMTLIGRTVDRYKITRLLGEGGFGAVYEAEHTLMKRRVAFKTLHRDLGKDPAVLHRFKKEGQVASRFKHKNAIELYDFGQMDDGTYFMAMEFLQGEDLRDRIKKSGGLEVGQTFDIIIQSLSALQAAHDAGVVHRDLKPDNIKLEDREGRKDFVKVLDFGIAKMKDQPGDEPVQAAFKTVAGAFFGTPEYGSPEQCAGEEIDHRSDLYTMGVIFYECITGSLPFVSKTPQGYLAQHMVAQPRPIREVRSDLNLPPEVEVVINKALEKKKEERYQSANEFADALIDCARKANIPITVEGGGSTVIIKTPTWKIAAGILGPLAVAAILFVLFVDTGPPVEEKEIIAAFTALCANDKNYEEAKNLLLGPTAAKFQGTKWYPEKMAEAESLIEQRDTKIRARLDEIRATWGETKTNKGTPDYDALAAALLALEGQEDFKFSPLNQNAKELAAEIRTTRDQHAQDVWAQLEPKVRRLMGLAQLPQAKELITQGWYTTFAATPTQALVDTAKLQIDDAIATGDVNLKEARLRYDTYLKVLAEKPEDFKEHKRLLNLILNDPKNQKLAFTTIADEARKELERVQKQWEAVAQKKFDELDAKSNRELEKGGPKGLGGAIRIWLGFPEEWLLETEAGKRVQRDKRAALNERASRGFDEADKKAKELLAKGKVPEAIAAVEPWVEFPEAAIDQTARAAVESLKRRLPLHEIGKAMVLLPAVEKAVVGAKDVPVASPPRDVKFEKPFYMDVHEVTNHEYWVYCNDIGMEFGRRPRLWDPNTGEYPKELAEHPVVWVTFSEAEAYAAWAGKRLPAEEEWEYAARGPDGTRVYPWGNEFGKPPPACVEGAAPKKVGSFLGGASPAGCMDMIGNVHEWTASWWERYPRSTYKDDDFDKKTHRTVRGGSFKTVGPAPLINRAASRFKEKPTNSRDDLGFRCCKSGE